MYAEIEVTFVYLYFLENTFKKYVGFCRKFKFSKKRDYLNIWYDKNKVILRYVVAQMRIGEIYMYVNELQEAFIAVKQYEPQSSNELLDFAQQQYLKEFFNSYELQSRCT